MNLPYLDYATYLSRIYPGKKIQKISVNAGFSCPNRDGTVGYGGCIYCLNTSFTPAYCFESSTGLSDEEKIRRQIEAGKKFFARKYPEMEYLAYFQSYTNTFSRPDTLEILYRSALETEGVVGLIVGTRPDMIPQPAVELLGRLNREKPVFVELGAESSFDATLKTINRGHDWGSVTDATRRLSAAGIRVGLHLIAGLPGEGERELLETVRRAVGLPIDSLKLHHLQVLRGTELDRRIRTGELSVESFSIGQYAEVCRKVIEVVPPHICIERFLASAPPEMVVSPRWGIKNYQFVNLLKSKFQNSKLSKI